MSASTVLQNLVTGLNSPAVIELCKRTGNRVSLVHRRDGRVRFLLVGNGYTSPAFATTRELSQFADRLLSGLLQRSV